jgi:hypothetical protein
LSFNLSLSAGQLGEEQVPARLTLELIPDAIVEHGDVRFQ